MREVLNVIRCLTRFHAGLVACITPLERNFVIQPASRRRSTLRAALWASTIAALVAAAIATTLIAAAVAAAILTTAKITAAAATISPIKHNHFAVKSLKNDIG